MKKILIIIDMQNDFITGCLGNKECEAVVKNVVDVINNGDYSNKDDEIDFVGVCTGICVISNVLLAKAAVPETKICVIENACACVTPESHKTAIEAMKTCQVDII